MSSASTLAAPTARPRFKVAARIALAAGAIAFALRIVMLVALPEAAIVSDTALYNSVALRLAGLEPGEPIGGFYRGFGYPAFLALFYELGFGYTGLRVVQALLWALAIGLAVYYCGRRFGPRPALICAALLLLVPRAWPHFVFLFTENLLVLELTGLWVLLLLRRRGSARSAIAFGVLLAALTLSHLAWQPFVPFALAALWHKRDVLVAGATFVLVMLAVLVPLHVAYPGQPWQSGKGGTDFGGGTAWTFYVGTHVETQGAPTQEDYDMVVNRSHPDSWYWEQGIDAVLSAPLDSASLLVAKAWLLWGGGSASYPSGSTSLDAVNRDVSPLLGALILLAGLAGGVIVARRDRWLGIVLALPGVWATAVFTVLGTADPRYVLATLPIMAILAGVALAGERHRTV